MSEKLLIHRGALCQIVRRIALEAGDVLLDYFDKGMPMELQAKTDGSPVTQADDKAEALIAQRLYDLLPAVPIVGEEMVEAGAHPDVTGAQYYWLVDALDGTREFINDGQDFTVNIALIHDGAPVLGVVYAPALGELYMGWTEMDGSGRALRWSEEGEKDKDVRVRAVPREGLTVMISRYYKEGGKTDEFLEPFKVRKLVRRSSSLKICLIAAGKADLYPRFGPTSHWDTAAGHAILHAAGGTLATEAGEELRYGASENFLNPFFIAASFSFADEGDNAAH